MGDRFTEGDADKNRYNIAIEAERHSLANLEKKTENINLVYNSKSTHKRSVELLNKRKSLLALLAHRRDLGFKDLNKEDAIKKKEAITNEIRELVELNERTRSYLDAIELERLTDEVDRLLQQEKTINHTSQNVHYHAGAVIKCEKDLQLLLNSVATKSVRTPEDDQTLNTINALIEKLNPIFKGYHDQAPGSFYEVAGGGRRTQKRSKAKSKARSKARSKAISKSKSRSRV
jgi:hypothetical protein